jgi:NAD(P)-dependent dehydrogenase (short-subunit alcohol dehydrogenase family)
MIMPKVLITGSARRIGKGLALAFADKGWDIVLHYNNSENEVLELSSLISGRVVAAHPIRADLRNENEIKKMFDDAFGLPGGIDVLINNAAIYPPRKSFEDTLSGDWDDVMNINLKSIYLTSKYYTSKLTIKGRIINFASLGGIEVWRNRLTYNVSKAGVIHLTKALARELAPKVQVNCISPGAIFFPDEPGTESMPFPESKIPMNRYGNVNDIIDAVYFFSTCSDYITGQNLLVDGALNLVK